MTLGKKLLLVLLLGLLPGFAFAVGAIAVDDEEGEDEPGYGIAVGKPSRADAERAALAECRKAGNKNCKVAVWFEGCGAYATSRKYYGVGWGRTIKIAEEKALQACNQRGCEIKLSECD